MELDILRMLIEQRNKKLEEEYKRNPAYDYLIDARENLGDNEKLLVAYLNILTNKPIEECQEIIKGLCVNSLKFTDSEFSLLVNLIVYFKCANALPEVEDYILERNPFKTAKAWTRIELGKNDKLLAMKLSDLVKKYKINVKSLIDLLEENPQAFIDICSLVEDVKEKNCDYTLARAKKQMYSRVTDFSENYAIFTKKLKPGRPTIEEAKTKIKKYVEALEHDERNYYKSAKLEQYHNENALAALEKELQKPEITNVRPLIKRVVDPQIKEIIVAIIYKHNLEYAKSIKNEYDKLMSNTTTRSLSLLHEYDIILKEEECFDRRFNLHIIQRRRS